MNYCGTTSPFHLPHRHAQAHLLVAALAVALAAPLSAAAETSADASGEASTLAPCASPVPTSSAPIPVQVIGRQQLEQTGKATVADVLRSISANTGNAANETTNNGWASGSAGISLRGLSQKNQGDVFYGSTSYAIAPAYGVTFAGSRSRIEGGARVTALPARQGAVLGGQAGFAYAIDWRDYNAGALAALQGKGVSARAAFQPFTTATAQGDVSFAAGDLVIPVAGQALQGAALLEAVTSAARGQVCRCTRCPVAAAAKASIWAVTASRRCANPRLRW